MHQPVRDFVASQTQGHRFASVVEVGGRNLNGGVRDLLTADQYTSVDLYDGPDVDVVANFVDWAADQDPVDCVVCCEVLEHAPDADQIVAAAARLATTVIITCATDPRAPHSGIEATAIQPGEFYRNVAPADLVAWCEAAGMTVDVVDTATRGDLYVTARRVNGSQ